MSCANTLTRSAAINGNDRMSCPEREEHTNPISSIDRKTPRPLIATLHIQIGRLVSPSCHSGQGKHLAGAQALTGGSQRNSAGLRRSDLPAGWSAMQRAQSLPRRVPSKACGPASNLASPQHPAGVISTPPSDLGSSPLPSANEPSQTLQNHDPDGKIPRVSAGLLIPTQPLRPPHARNSVSNALPSHSDPT